MERTSEIGLARAIGATPTQILLLFLSEAALLSTLGGALGLLSVEVLKFPGGASYSGSFRADYWGTGGTLYDRVGDAISLLSGAWCVVPPGVSKPGTCSLPTGAPWRKTMNEEGGAWTCCAGS